MSRATVAWPVADGTVAKVTWNQDDRPEDDRGAREKQVHCEAERINDDRIHRVPHFLWEAFTTVRGALPRRLHVLVFQDRGEKIGRALLNNDLAAVRFIRTTWEDYQKLFDIGVAQKDISLHNVLVQTSEGQPRPLLIDFHAGMLVDPETMQPRDDWKHRACIVTAQPDCVCYAAAVAGHCEPKVYKWNLRHEGESLWYFSGRVLEECLDLPLPRASDSASYSKSISSESNSQPRTSGRWKRPPRVYVAVHPSRNYDRWETIRRGIRQTGRFALATAFAEVQRLLEDGSVVPNRDQRAWWDDMSCATDNPEDQSDLAERAPPWYNMRDPLQLKEDTAKIKQVMRQVIARWRKIETDLEMKVASQSGRGQAV